MLAPWLNYWAGGSGPESDEQKGTIQSDRGHTESSENDMDEDLPKVNDVVRLCPSAVDDNEVRRWVRISRHDEEMRARKRDGLAEWRRNG